MISCFVTDMGIVGKRRVIAGFVLSIVLAACASTSPPMVTVPIGSSAPVIASVPGPPVPIDGTYGGVLALTRGNSYCGDQDPFTLQVVNHAFSFRLPQPRAEWKPFIIFNGRIGDDGSFNVQSGTGNMRGRVSGGNMQGEVSGDMCGFTFDADRGGI
jgi:hypothetical protein